MADLPSIAKLGAWGVFLAALYVIMQMATAGTIAPAEATAGVVAVTFAAVLYGLGVQIINWRKEDQRNFDRERADWDAEKERHAKALEVIIARQDAGGQTIVSGLSALRDALRDTEKAVSSLSEHLDLVGRIDRVAARIEVRPGLPEKRE